MVDRPTATLLDAILDSWDRNNTILVNLLRAVPPDCLDLEAAEGSWPIMRLFAHMHYCRLLFVHEDAPEFGTPAPTREAFAVRDQERMAELLNESALAVRDAFRGKVEAGTAMNTRYDHPILLVQHMIWHEGYHHGQIKLALKLAGRAMDDEEIGRVTWDVWMDKTRVGA